MMYYEVLKIIRNKPVIYAWLFLLLMNAACTLYAAWSAGEDGVSFVQAAAAAEAWSGMPVAEALDDVNHACDAYREQMSAGTPVTEEDYLRGVILSAEKNRLEQLSGYGEYREEIRVSAKAMDQISFFGSPDSFTHRAAEKTREVYEKLSVRELTSDYPDGVRLIINNRQTQAILFLTGLAFAMLIFLQDQDSGMLPLLFSKRAGRSRTALAKMAALWAVSALTCALFYGSNVLLAWKLVGIGDLNRPVQTLNGFYTSPWGISVGIYLLVFLLFLIFAQATAGTVFGCLCVRIKNGKLAAAVVGIVCAAEYLFAGYSTGWLKYFNLVTLTDPNVFFCDYVCVNLFGMPVSILAAGIFALVFLTVISGIGVVVSYSVQKAVPSVMLDCKKPVHKRAVKKHRQMIIRLR